MRLRPGEQVRIRDQWWRVRRVTSGSSGALLDVTGCSPGAAAHATFVLPAEHVDRRPPSSAPMVVRPRRWRHVARAALASAAAPFCSLITLARSDIAIMPFQLEPALAVTLGAAARLLIADAVGTGKTIQAALVIAEVLERHPHGRVLVVVPPTLRDQWADELRGRFALEATVLDGPGLARVAAEGPPGGNPWQTCRIGITSVDYVKRPEVIRALEGLVWDVLVLDEAHALSGTSERASAARNLAHCARVVVMLSATPHSGDSDAFERLCGTGRLPSDAPLAVFRRQRRHTQPAQRRRSCWLRVRPGTSEAAMHGALERYAQLVGRERTVSGAHARLAMAVLRKRACSSATSLARSVERRLELLRLSGGATSNQPLLPFDEPGLDDDEPVALMAVPGLSDRETELALLHELLEIARAASRQESKPAALRRLLRRAGEPALVFTEYRDTLLHLASLLPDSVLLHGGLTSRERRLALSAFTSGAARLLLATDAASEGLNLHYRCRLVVNLELPWTPTRLEQRIGRVDRLGQQRRVHAINFVAAGTDEERVGRRLLQREARATRDLGPGDEISVAATSQEQSAAAVLPVAEEPAGHGRDDRTAHLAQTARAEARRAELSRVLRPILPVLSTRAVVTSAVHGGSPATRFYCAGRVTFFDPAGQPVWEVMVGAGVCVEPRPAGDPDAVRTLVRRIWPAVDEHLAAACSSSADGTLLVGRYVATFSRRERDVAAELHRTAARLAAVQAGLFDRRTEKQAAARRTVLVDALRRCHERLCRLDDVNEARAGAVELVVGIAI